MIESLERRLQCATTGRDPTYGDHGVATQAIADTGPTKALLNLVVASRFAASGAGYVEVAQQYPADSVQPENAFLRFAVYRVLADGTFDKAFGTGGRYELQTDGYYYDYFHTFAVSPSGRLVVTDTQRIYHLFDANGREQPGATKRLNRAIRSVTDANVVDDFNFSPLATFDSEGRLILAAETLVSAFPDYLFPATLYRFNTNGTLDTTFGDGGHIRTTITTNGLDHAGPSLAAGRDGRIAFATAGPADNFIRTEPGGATVTAGDVNYFVFSPAGALVKKGTLATPKKSGSDDAEVIETDDLRPLADGGFAALSRSVTDGELSMIRADGTLTNTPLPATIDPPLRLTPAGTPRGWVGGTADDAYPALEGRTDRFRDMGSDGYYDDFTILGDGTLIAAGLDRFTDTPTILIQKFDGTGLATPAARGTARSQTETRTLDVRGTNAADVITIRTSGGRLRVRINGVITTYALADFDTLHVSAGAGDDSVSVDIGPQNLAVRVRGDGGNDRLETDAYRSTLEGGDGRDVGTLRPGSEMNPVGIEFLRHPGRRPTA